MAEVGKLKLGDGLKLLVNYHTARDRSTKKMEGRIAKHLTPFFGANRLMASITGAVVTAYVAKRKAEVTILPACTTRKVAIPERRKPVKNATINRELAWLKQMFTLAIRAGQSY